ncbi:MAG: hypothetical protein ABSG46_03355 [Candidatus Binataceae bacterium]|jgi:hypothetical protein
MKRTGSLISIAALVFSVASALPARAVTPPNGAIQGTWAFGVDVQEEGLSQANGTLTFNGNGGVTGVLTYNFYNTVCQGMTLTGSYTVNPGKLSGTAIMTVTSVSTANCDELGNGDTLSLVFSMFNNLKGMNFMESDAKTTGSFYDAVDAPLWGVATHF